MLSRKKKPQPKPSKARFIPSFLTWLLVGLLLLAFVLARAWPHHSRLYPWSLR
jgi:hypothetical protein